MRMTRASVLAFSVLVAACGPQNTSTTADNYKGFIDGATLDSKFQSGICPTATSSTARCTSYNAQQGFVRGQPIFFYNMGGFTAMTSIRPSDLKALDSTVAYQFATGQCSPGKDFDTRNDQYPAKTQFPIFATLPLPARTGAVPTLPFVNVKAFGTDAQFGAKASGANEVRLWAVIDPVLPLNPGAAADFKPEGYGWHNNLLLSYLDGGPVPVNEKGEVQSMEGVLLDPPGVTTFGRPTDARAILLPFRRGEAGFSPVVRLRSFRIPTGKTYGDFTGICATGMNCAANEVNLPSLPPTNFNTIFIVSQ
jgi:hypothetical protein